MSRNENITEEMVINQEPCEPAKLGRRFLSGFFDLILIIATFVGLYQLLLLTPLGSIYQNHRNNMIEIEDYYKVQKLVKDSDETYGYKVYSYEEQYEEQKKGKYIHVDDFGEYVVVNNVNPSDVVVEAYKKNVSNNQQYLKESQSTHLLNFAIASISLLISETTFFFIIPCLNKKRRTLGKMLFKLEIVNSNDLKNANILKILIRFLFILLFDSVLLFYFIGQWIFVAMPFAFGVFSLFTQRHLLLHDIISMTYVIDSYTYEEEKVELYNKTLKDSEVIK